MNELAATTLRSRRSQQAAERLRAGGEWHDLDLVFTTRTGMPISRWALRRAFSDLTTSAGLGNWHPTELRHSVVSLLSDSGVHLEKFADLAGHSTRRMTGKFYRPAVRPAVGAEATQVMNRLFSEKPTDE